MPKHVLKLAIFFTIVGFGASLPLAFGNSWYGLEIWKTADV